MFNGIKNLSAVSAFKCEAPWEYAPKVDFNAFESKDQFREWAFNQNTEHLFVSVVEGLSSAVRVSYADNPPYLVYGVIADFDAKNGSVEAAYDSVQKQQIHELKPSWLVETYSHHQRLIWLFEKPLYFSSKEQYKAFVQRFAKELKLQKWLAGLDTGALTDAVKYYEVGRRWVPLAADYRCPHQLLTLWQFESGQRVALSNQPKYKIPIEAVAAAVAEKYPGRWHGAFDIGRRGCRFWDPSAADETAAIIREDGVQCFTNNAPNDQFMPWRKILGAVFMDKFEADRMAPILNETVYDSRDFWVQVDGRWVDMDKSDYGQRLRTPPYNFNSLKGKGETCSEVDLVEVAVKTQRRVEVAVPILFMPPGIIEVCGKKVLNTSTVRPMQPAPPMTEGKMTWADGRQYFPFLQLLFRSMFADGDNDIQLVTFFCWWKFSYENALNGTPRGGHATCIAGPVGKGKTFVSRYCYATSMCGIFGGGFEDASAHLVDGSRWTQGIAEKPVLAMDDSSTEGDIKKHMAFTAKVKKFVANQSLVYDRKFKDSQQIPWYGRIIITCNDDTISQSILPGMDSGAMDKIMLLKTSNKLAKFPEWAETKGVVMEELPYFLRFLLDMEYPASIMLPDTDNKRFGPFKPYYHPDLLAESQEQGIVGLVQELLVEALAVYEAGHKGVKEWVGSSTAAYSLLETTNAGALRGLSPRQVSTALGLMVRLGYNVTRTRSGDHRGVSVWTIQMQLKGGGNGGGAPGGHQVLNGKVGAAGRVGGENPAQFDQAGSEGRVTRECYRGPDAGTEREGVPVGEHSAVGTGGDEAGLSKEARV